MLISPKKVIDFKLGQSVNASIQNVSMFERKLTVVKDMHDSKIELIVVTFSGIVIVVKLEH